MDINDLRVVMTVLAFIVFIGIVAWAYSRKRKRAFEEAARLPFSDRDLGEDIAAGKETERKR
jgi:cytochrome c oxidase cbb3-type subunit IV